VSGRSGGGISVRPYADETEALNDVLRLSRPMTYKMALAGIAIGGAKTVIIGDPKALKTPELLAAYGRYVESLGGAYLAGPDIGTKAEDMAEMPKTTRFVAGRADQSGSTAITTAIGTYVALRATAKAAFGSDTLAGHRISVQGAGGVGGELISRLLAEGAEVIAADIDPAALAIAARKGAKVVDPSLSYDFSCRRGEDGTAARRPTPSHSGVGSGRRHRDETHGQACCLTLRPPSMVRQAAVMNGHSSEIMNTAARAISSGVAMRPCG